MIVPNRSFLDAIPFGMLLVDQAGKVLVVNQVAAGLFGYEVSELIGQPVEILVPEPFRDRHPAWRVQLGSGPLARPMGKSRDVMGLRKDGTEFPVEVGLNPIETEQGFGGVLASIVDLTHRKQTEEMLREREARLRFLVEQMPCLLWTVDLELRITSVVGTIRPFLHLPQDLLLGSHLAEHFRDDPLGSSLCSAHQQACEGTAVSWEANQDGRFTRVQLQPLGDGQGNLTGCIGVALDVTRHKQMELELAAAHRMQQRMLPQESPSVPGLDIAGACHPAAAVGGDYFDYLYLPDGSLGVVVADVSSHGFAPALLMTETRRLLRSSSASTSDLGEILKVANLAIAADTTSDDYVTLFLARINLANRCLQYVGAGHEGYVVEASGDKGKLASTTLPLGIDPRASMVVADPMHLQAGQVLILTTDGLTEAMSPTDGYFGKTRVFEFVQRHRTLSAREILEALWQSVREFCHPHQPHDDLTTVIIKVEPGDIEQACDCDTAC